MSSASRNEKLEQVLEARYQAFHAEDGKAAKWAAYESLLDEVRAGTNYSRFTIEEAILSHWDEYRRNRSSYEKPRSARPRI